MYVVSCSPFSLLVDRKASRGLLDVRALESLSVVNPLLFVSRCSSKGFREREERARIVQHDNEREGLLLPARSGLINDG